MVNQAQISEVGMKKKTKQVDSIFFFLFFFQKKPEISSQSRPFFFFFGSSGLATSHMICSLRLFLGAVFTCLLDTVPVKTV